MTEAATAPRAARGLVGSTVLQVVPALSDDPFGHAVLDVAMGLLRSGARSLVAGGGGVLVGELQALGGEWMALDLAQASRLRGRRVVQSFATTLAMERVDLVHAHGAEAAACALPAARSARTSLVTSYLGAPPPAGWGRTAADAQAQGDAVLACSRFAADAIVQHHHVPHERLMVVPRGLDTRWFDPAAIAPDRVAAVRQSWRVRPQARVILVPGKLRPSGGHLPLIDAVRSLVNGGLRGVVFVLAGADAGDPGYAEAVDARIVDQGVAGVVRRAGFCPDMPAAYAACDFVVLPTERASIFRMAAVEAQAMGRPVVACALGALPELVLDPPAGSGQPRTGWLVPPHEPLALARAIAAALATDTEAMQALSAEARRFAEAVFAPERVAAAILTVYRGLLRGPVHAGPDLEVSEPGGHPSGGAP